MWASLAYMPLGNGYIVGRSVSGLVNMVILTGHVSRMLTVYEARGHIYWSFYRKRA